MFLFFKAYISSSITFSLEETVQKLDENVENVKSSQLCN